MASKVEGAVAVVEMSTVYKITKHLCDKNTSQSAPVKDRDDNILTTKYEPAARWVPHFREVLNCFEADDPLNLLPANNVLS